MYVSVSIFQKNVCTLVCLHMHAMRIYMYTRKTYNIHSKKNAFVHLSLSHTHTHTREHSSESCVTQRVAPLCFSPSKRPSAGQQRTTAARELCVSASLSFFFFLRVCVCVCLCVCVCVCVCVLCVLLNFVQKLFFFQTHMLLVKLACVHVAVTERHTHI
jgi:hypothetical protein